MLPYPSDFFTIADSTLPTGRRVEVGASARLRTIEDRSADLHDGQTSDGFSTNAIITLVFDKPPAREKLVRYLDDPSRSMSPASRTLIIQASSGALLPHFVDVDPLATEISRTAVVLHPLEPLLERTRYVVAVRGVEAEDGARIAAAEGFRRIRDAEVSDDLADLAERYERDLFPVVERAGVPRAELILAFDFTTGSRDLVEVDLLAIRAQTLEWLAGRTQKVTITHVTGFEEGPVLRTIEGKIEAPLYLTSDAPEARAVRDEAGLPRISGVVEVPFRAQIPRSLELEGRGAAVEFGHGFFGRRSEVDADRIRALADHLKLVMFAIDWWGFSRDDMFLVVDALVARPNELFAIVDRLEQAMSNWMALAAAIEGPLAKEPAFARTSSDSVAIYDPSRVAYLGASAGHILGGTLAALSPKTTRWSFNAGGAGLGQIMFRARPFAPLLEFLSTGLPDPLDQQKYVATVPEAFDRVDPAFWAARVLEDPLEGNEPRRVLIQTGLGDAQVPNVGAFLHARALGVPSVAPSPRAVFGVEDVEGPIEGSAIAIYDFGLDPVLDLEPDPTRPGNEVHDRLLQLDPAHAQIAEFLGTGRIVNPCDGTCDPL